jgi:cellulose biosynthesis protein BcsQ
MAHAQIAFFNHKGGVSKTTSVFNIGWMLAEKGHTVLLVDCDPQCNLTGLVLDYKNELTYKFESKTEVLNIRDALAPAFQARPVGLAAPTLQKVRNRKGLYILPGHVGFAEYESQLAIAHDLSSAIPALQNIPGSIRWMLDLAASSIEADYVLVDMSPSLGSINQNLWASSDAFVVPMAPDYFSAMALRSLATVLPRWHAWSRQAAFDAGLASSAYPWPQKTPRYLGSIVQNYRIRRRDGKEAAPTRAYQEWFDELKRAKAEDFVPALTRSDLMLTPQQYRAARSPVSDFMLEVPDFNSLVASSQEHSKPVFKLTSADLQSTGVVAATQEQSVERFKAIYGAGADKIVAMASHAIT